MHGIPEVGEQDIRQWVGEQSFRRGCEYAQTGAIFDARRQGMTLKGCCDGSHGEVYRLWAALAPQAVAGADCSCPVGADGRCKHVAALLLTWLQTPGEFLQLEDLDASLERRTKAELIAVIKQMVRQRPDLEVLLETPLPGADAGRAPVRPEVYRRQAAAVFRRAGSDWGAVSGIAEELLAITAIGDGFAQQQDYPSATAVFSAVVEEVLENYELFHDEEGELASVVGECVDGLGTCLAGEREDAATRAKVLDRTSSGAKR